VTSFVLRVINPRILSRYVAVGGLVEFRERQPAKLVDDVRVERLAGLRALPIRTNLEGNPASGISVSANPRHSRHLQSLWVFERGLRLAEVGQFVVVVVWKE